MATFRVAAGRVLGYPAWDALFVGLSLVHGAALAVMPAAPVVAVLLWWNANTISHNFIHRPFFGTRTANRLYSAYLTLVLGFPQTLWRQRHLRHHAELAELAAAKPAAAYKLVGRSGFWTGRLAIELLLLAGFWTLLATQLTPWFLTAYLPGWAIGLGLCQLQGYYEHARGTRSHYGRIYNFLFFNDGLHVEHHRRPGLHWTELGQLVQPQSPHSRWPPVLRWLDAVSLEGLERLVLRSPRLQRLVVAAHERAFRRLLPLVGDARRVTIVGGGLFPRTALVLRKLLPDAELTVVDACAAHIEIARPMLGDGVRFVHEAFDPARSCDADLLIIPLSFNGQRRRIYERPPASAVLVHDWIAASHQPSAIVSWLLLKRLNLVRSSESSRRQP
jgi:fatty acid desaturase